jgi:hypothetical protein
MALDGDVFPVGRGWGGRSAPLETAAGFPVDVTLPGRDNRPENEGQDEKEPAGHENKIAINLPGPGFAGPPFPSGKFRDIAPNPVVRAREFLALRREGIVSEKEFLNSAGNSVTLRVKLENKPGVLGRLIAAIGGSGGNIGAIDIVRMERNFLIRDITVETSGPEHADAIAESIRGTAGAELLQMSDRTFLLHLRGKIEVASKIPLKTRDDLSMAYTPGVARICRAIHEKRSPPTTSPSRATPWPSSRTDRRCWGWGTSVPWRPCR